MTWQDAQTEAARRLWLLPAPPPPARLDGLTVTLIEFETDEIAGVLAGGNSATFQRMVNRALRRRLESRGATVVVRIITLAETMRWIRNTKRVTHLCPSLEGKDCGKSVGNEGGLGGQVRTETDT